MPKDSDDFSLDEAVAEAENSKDEGFMVEESELKQVMKSLDADDVDKSTKMSSIDFGARLSGDEIKHMLIIDELVRIGIFPATSGITRQFKRLSVSLRGAGRAEKVSIVQGERQQRSGGGLGAGLLNLFKPQG